MAEPRSVLLVEKSSDWAKVFRDRLPAEATMVWAPSVSEAERLYRDHRWFDAVIIGDVDSPAEALAFVASIRSNFRGPIIAAVTNVDAKVELVKAGCNHWIKLQKTEAVNSLRLVFER